jgi:hypothetical protein
MKVSTSLVVAAASANAHYTFPSTIYNGVRAGDWQTVRMTENRYHNGPVTDVNSQAMTCYELNPGQGAPQTLGVTAGSTVTIAAGGGIFHPGPLHAYLAKVPAGKTAKNFDGKGAVWFKIYQDGPTGFGTGTLSWPSDSMFWPLLYSLQVPVLIPSRQAASQHPHPPMRRERRVPPPRRAHRPPQRLRSRRRPAVPVVRAA